MANYAVIKNGLVDNIIVADSLEIAQQVTQATCVEIPFEPGSPTFGWNYDGVSFTPPVVETPIEEIPTE